MAVEDIGKFALLSFDKHAELNGNEIGLAGDEKTMPEIAVILGRILGREIEFIQMQLSDLKKIGLDFAKMTEWQNSAGYDVDIPGLKRKYGLEMLPFEQWASKAEWKKPVMK